MLGKLLRADAAGIEEAARLVRDHVLVAYPTDTVYAIGCDPFSDRAVERLVEIKGGREKPFPVLISNLSRGEELGKFSEMAKKLATAFWPGPLTLVLPLKRNVPERLGGREATIGLRMPNHQIALTLLAQVGGFLVGTSANLTGQTPCTSHEQVLRVFGNRIDAIIEGRSGSTLSSTIIEVHDREYTILREGPIGRATVENALGR